MENTNAGPRAIALTVLLAFSGGCLAQQPEQGGADDCNPVATGVIGGILGGLFGGGKRRVAGAAIGAAVGALACVVINASTKQTKTAADVEKEVVAAKGELPAEPTVVSYRTSINPDAPVRPGADVTVASEMEVTGGQKNAVSELKEEIILSDPSGKEFRRGSKAIGQPGQAIAGGYQNVFGFKLPESAPQGVYAVRTILYLDGKSTNSSEQRFQVVHSDTGAGSMVAAVE